MADSANKELTAAAHALAEEEAGKESGLVEDRHAKQKSSKLTVTVFLNKVLSGTALGVIIGLIPNAVLSGILKYLGTNTFAVTLTQIAVIFQLATPLIIGGLIALQFELNPMQMMVTAGAAFVGSGVVKFNPALKAYVGSGTGDLINTMITASIAVLLLIWIKDRFGSTAVVAMPILVGCGTAYIGVLLLPFIAAFTTAIGGTHQQLYHLAANSHGHFNLLLVCYFDYQSDFNRCHWASHSTERYFGRRIGHGCGGNCYCVGCFLLECQ